jgi:hypothetical protein
LPLELKIPWIGYRPHMDVGRSTSSLEKMGIVGYIQELAMTWMSDYVSLTGSIMNSSIEVHLGAMAAWIFLTSTTPRRGLGVKM